MLKLSDMGEREILALAISNEEDDARTYADIADELQAAYPDTAQIFSDMAAEENQHRRALLDLFQHRFGDHVPLIRRHDVHGFRPSKPIWQLKPLGIESVRHKAQEMEAQARRFYEQAMERTTDIASRKLLGDLAAAEAQHEHSAAVFRTSRVTPDAARREDEDASRRFVLQVIQPGLVGLMDGSVSTLAPVFAAAFATHDPWNAFLVGLAASLGAGISMGFAEALADDGKLSGRGTPLLRGLVCGLMTIAGGIGHTIPYLIPDFITATIVAGVVVVFELAAIAWIQWRYMETPPLSAAAKVMLGGGLVLATGILIGNA